MVNNGFEEIAHTADLALRIWGKDLSELMIQAAHGMNKLMTDKLPESPGSITWSISVSGMDEESLLVAWLSELAYIAESKGIIFSKFTVRTISKNQLTADLIGQRVLNLNRTIKAVTYHALKIIRGPQGLEATVVFDV